MTVPEAAEMFEVSEEEVLRALVDLGLFHENATPQDSAVYGRFVSEDGKLMRRAVSMLSNLL